MVDHVELVGKMKPENFNKIPQEKLEELFWNVKLYLENWIVIRPEDGTLEEELQLLWDSYYACEDTVEDDEERPTQDA